MYNKVTMKIDNINTHNTNPQFKELRLKKGANNYISKMPEKASSKLEDIKEYLANTEFYHLDIGKDEFYITRADGEKFYQPYLSINAGKVLLLKARQGLTQISKKLKYDNAAKVKQLCQRISGGSTQIERAAFITKILDDYQKGLK